MSDKWKQLIDLIVNEEEDKASELFHEIVIESSREIYENLITSEDLVDEADVEETSEDEVEDFIDEIQADEEGISEEDDDMEDAADEMADEMDMEEPADEPEADEDMENRVIELEDEMEALKAEFAALVDDHDDEDEADEEAEEAEESVAFEAADEEVAEDAEEVAEDAEEIEEAEEIVEYTEKAPAPKGGADDNAKSTVAKSGKGGIKNASSAEEKGAPAPKAQDMGGTTKPDMKKV